MMIHILFSLIILFSPSQCQYGQPCNPIPWSYPPFPVLLTPTPIPTIIATANIFTPTPTVTGTPPTSTLMPTATAPLDLSGVDDHLATMQYIAEATIEASDSTGAFDLGANAGSFWPYMMSLGQIHFGVFTPLIQFAIFALVFVVTVRLGLMLLPAASAFIGILRKVVQTILDFIPG